MLAAPEDSKRAVVIGAILGAHSAVAFTGSAPDAGLSALTALTGAVACASTRMIQRLIEEDTWQQFATRMSRCIYQLSGAWTHSRRWRMTRTRNTEIAMSRNDFLQSISRREFVWNSLAVAAYFTFRGSAQAAPSSHEAPATHNWMLVGSQTAFLSHLPMFDHLNAAGTDYVTPHRFQVILQASFEKNGTDVTNLYFADRESHAATKMFTVTPANLSFCPNSWRLRR